MGKKFLHLVTTGGALFTCATGFSSCSKDSTNTKITRDYQIFVHLGEDIEYSYAYQINEALDYFCHFQLPIVSDSSMIKDHEIIFDMTRKECADLLPKLDDDEYIIKERDSKIIIVSKSHMAKMCAVDHLLTDYCSKDGLIVPKNTEVKGKCKASDIVTEITLPDDPDSSNKFHEIRDPFIVKEGNDYYMYGTSYWDGIDWRAYHTTGSFKNEWENLGKVAEIGETYPDIVKQRWAPEVHKYKDKFYMFTTYLSQSSRQRGVTILRSDLPTGEFKMISHNARNVAQFGNDNHHITYDLSTIDKEGKPAGCTIDGTLYVDPDGQPWLVYVNEWVSQTDEVGRFSAVKLSEDLTEIDESSNKELFRADAAPWGEAGIKVTDGCFIHTMPNGRLVMTWSASNGHGYSVGFATSDNGVLGPWVQHKQQLFAPGMYASDNPEGGHAMIFEDNDQLFMCLHGPNAKTEHPIVFPIKETHYNTIAWDLYQKGK
ncbi:MAG: family 43 glycosylhydrolase [Bacilli bacterium]|nr:family 43 glycosylhydrolase [Bacilli bacterium]